MAVVVGGALVGAALFGGLSAYGAASSNAAMRRQAEAQQRANNESIINARRAFFDQTRVAARQYQRESATVNNALFADRQKGHSLNRIVNYINRNAVEDQQVRARRLSEFEKNVSITNRNIASSGAAQQQSPLLEGAKGAVSGAQMGAAVGGAIESFNQSQQLKAFQSDLSERFNAGDPTAMARLEAFQAGVPVDSINADTIAPFMQRQALSSMQFESQMRSLQSQLGIGLLRDGFLDQALNNLMERWGGLQGSRGMR
jgi:predicted ATPase